MGNASVKAHLQEEFERVSDGKEIIHLREIIEIKPPGDVETLSLTHLGTLYVIDEAKKGYFELVDLIKFADLCAVKESEYLQNEFSTMMQSYCTLTLWEDVTTPQGQDGFVDWFISLFASDTDVAVDGGNGVVHIMPDGVLTLHGILNVEKGYGLPLDEFISLMRNAAGVETVLDEALLNAVPLPTLARFATCFIRGFASMMEGLGFDPSETYRRTPPSAS
ncbi:uncharacterized protein AMSG_06866 [Thecamonas trahens ATCC 50062]|uniref:Uncharacterized protein n=1 Tax=Thecamonas trahens ATCC 50062 TaxID=461836 RepID=A0A0L0DGA8_THETB|nr:hypothetical protein AMSG_06866 [Thecamonas trahens ATCC 50062]KNC50378.1 hypothetical protein AMSG_06866 [Thecamonas trahens ATCC 50062]|eukprot:XP_013756920.1 hypothetical protein AMSG_06866 [Thecamonas trahens ATCC 50062]